MAEQYFKDITRIADKDVKGNLKLAHALIQAKGVGHMFANAVCSVLKLDREKKIGAVLPEELEKIEDCMRHPEKYNIPLWLFNRRKDRETGENKHLLSSELDLTQKFDIRRMKKIRSYKGIRHAKGLPVRGQRTRSTGRTGTTLGVARAKKVSSGK